MGRRTAATAGPRVPRSTAPTTPLVDVKILVIAAVVASPAAYNASQGLLTVDQAITRFLLVALACMATATVVRAVWPILAGPSPEKVSPGGPGVAAEDPSMNEFGSGSEFDDGFGNGFGDGSPDQ